MPPETPNLSSPETARDALRRRRQFNIICQQTSWKAELIVQKADAFAQAEFDAVHTVERARAVGSLDALVELGVLRSWVIENLEADLRG